MPSGGARHRSGPTPAIENSDWTHIKNVPCERPVPAFPLPDPSERELYLWQKLWVKPQAEMWHKQDQAYEVALYTRRFTEAEQSDSSVTLNTLVRQMGDSLGITAPGLRSNRWLLVDDVIEIEETKAKPIPSARARLKAGGVDE